MRASFMLLGPAARPVRAGHHQQPRRRPDRPAAGRPPRRGDAGAGRRRSTTATATTSHGAGPAARAPRIRFPFVSVMGTENAMLAATLAEGHTVIRPAAQEPEVDDLIDVPPVKMGAEVERTYPDTIEIEGASAPPRRRAPGDPRPDRGRHVRRRRRRHRRPGHARGRAVRPPRRVRRDCSSGIGRRHRRAARDTIEVDAPACGAGGIRAVRHRDRALSRAGDRPPAARRACC